MNSSRLTNINAANPSTSEPKAWWSFGMVWLVIAGPAVVVVAAFATLYLAITIPDPVLPTEISHPRNTSDKKSDSSSDNTAKFEAAMAPAMQARNHASTNVVPEPKK